MDLSSKKLMQKNWLGIYMSRIHSKRKGASASKKPYRAEKLEWVSVAPEEVEKLVVKLSKEGYSTSEIGIRLRDIHGVPDIREVTGKNVVKILSDNGIKFSMPEDIQNLMNLAQKLRAYVAANEKDLHNKRSLALVESKIRRLGRYYKGKKVLPATWNYAPETKERAAEKK